MRRALFGLLFLIAGISAALALTPGQKIILFGPPAWVPPGMTVALDFANNRYYGGSIASSFTISSGTNGWNLASNNIWTQQATSNALRLTDLGAWIEEARTNVALQNRDLTNVAWVTVNATAAKDQVGIDGVTNSASSLTATAGNATVLQAITLGSSARFQSAFVKRITGSGTINMTTDGGLSWIAITPCASGTALGAPACRVTIPSQTVLNPSPGFQIVTSGDAIAVDMVQNENGDYATTPIAVAGSAVTRAADNITITLAGSIGRIIANPTGTIVITGGPTEIASGVYGAGLDFMHVLGDGAPGFAFFRYGSATNFNSNSGSLGVSPDVTANVVRTALSWGGAITASTNGLATGSAGTGALDAGTWTLGSYNASTSWYNAPMKMVAAGPTQFLGGQLRSLSTYP